MLHYVIELAVWTLAIFLVGCLAGAVARQAFGKPDGRADAPRPASQDDREST